MTPTPIASWEQVREEWAKAEQMGSEAVLQAAKVGQMLIELREGLSSQAEFVQRAGQEAGIAKSQAFNLMALGRNMSLLIEKQPGSQRAALALIAETKVRPTPTPATTPTPTPATTPEQAEADGLRAELREEIERSNLMRQNLSLLISDEEFRLIRSCLHPDRVPEEQRSKFDKAFTAINRMAPFFDNLRVLEKRRQEQSERSKAMWANRKAAEANAEAAA